MVLCILKRLEHPVTFARHEVKHVRKMNHLLNLPIENMATKLVSRFVLPKDLCLKRGSDMIPTNG